MIHSVIQELFSQTGRVPKEMRLYIQEESGIQKHRLEHTVLRSLKDPADILRANPQFTSRLKEAQVAFPQETIVAVLPKANWVIAAWRDEGGEEKIVGFKPNLSCTQAATGCIARFYGRKDYFLGHTTPRYLSLKEMADDSSLFQVQALQGDIRRGRINLQTYRAPIMTLTFNRNMMSPVDYLALEAKSLISGEDVQEILGDTLTQTRR